jgi:type IV pilus assembly protein PilW
MKNLRLGITAASRGFTIVEFMVAIAIGLIVSLVVGQIFVGSRQSFSSQEDSARMQENMRSASILLTRTIRLAGYPSNAGLNPNDIFPKASAPAITGVDNLATSGMPSGTDPVKPTASSPATVPDTITVRYQGSGNGTGTPDQTIVDCSGAYVDFNATSANLFAIRPATKPDGVLSSSLYCSIDNGTNWQELVPDIDNMQILYGVDTDADGSANVYQRIADVTSADQLDKVVSVRLWLLMRSPTATNLTVASTTYSLAGVNYTYTDRFVRRVLYTTINLRNRVR